MSQTILITGAGGFLGQALAVALAQDPNVKSIRLTDVQTPRIPETTNTKNMFESLAADLTSKDTCTSLLTPDITHIYAMHGIMSGQAESNYELGFEVNVDSMRHVVDVLRRQHKALPTKVIFPSSLAVFGPAEQGSVVTEKTVPLPQSSYGAEKAMVEILLNDLSRRGVIDARIVRLPTIIVRPGKPTGAASSFFSGVIREPLNGVEARLPVRKDLKAWVCSARTVVRNLVTSKDIPSESFNGESRIVNLPGSTIAVQDLLSALEKVGSKQALNFVKTEYDESVSRIVSSWPAVFDTAKATQLGFHDDVSLEQTVKDYVDDYMT